LVLADGFPRHHPRIVLDDPKTILSEITALVDLIRPEEYEVVGKRLLEAPRVMAYGTGRSGFVLRSFIMRLNHLGHTAYYVGDASTPPVAAGDTFLVMSGSGTTATSLGAAMEAAKLGASVVAIVGSRLSPMGQLAEALVELPAPHTRGIAERGVASRQTAGSLFEQAAFVVLESLVLGHFRSDGEDVAAPLARHANLEA
jgi:6-phospho-3-hexuloisomerase